MEQENEIARDDSPRSASKLMQEYAALVTAEAIEIRDTPDEMKHEAENYGWRKSMADIEINGITESPIVGYIPARL